MANISTVHDRFVRELLADKSIAIDYFKSALPAHISRKLDFLSMEQVSGSYVSGELEHTISDVVYSCGLKGGNGSVEISILLEHKSFPDKFTPVQVGGYIFSGYQQQIKQKRKQLSPIIPILFYHGKQKWEYWTLDRLFPDLDEEFIGFLPKYDYIYQNLRDTPDEEIKAIRNQFLLASLLVLKHSFDRIWLEENFTGMLSIGLIDNEGYLQQAFLTYYFNRVNLPKDQVIEMIKELPLKIKNSIMSTYEMLLETGEKRGIEKGKTEFVTNLILDTDFRDEKIASLATVSIEFVRKIRASLAKK